MSNSTDTLLVLDPDSIAEPNETNVRPFSIAHGDTEAEIAAIEALEKSIAASGQIQPIKVAKIDGAKEGEPQYMLIAGRRRKRAVQMHNMALADGAEPMKLIAVVSEEEGMTAGKLAVRMFKQAAHENLHRAGLSPMDFAMDIATVRKNMGSKGSTQKVAEFFGVSPAQITQHEKLLSDLPEDVQLKVHTGELSRDDAFGLAKIAKTQGAEEASKTAQEAVDAGKEEEAAAAATGTGKKAAKKKAAAKKAVIKKKLQDDPNTKTPRSKKEILAFFESCYGPLYGHPNGAVHQFVDNLIKYAAGEVTDRTLYKYFDLMVDKAPKGTAEAKKDNAPNTSPATSGKGVSKGGKPAGKKAAK